MWTLIVAIFAGIILGSLARIVMPGKQKIGVIVTILLGAVGALAGSWLSNELFGTGDKIFAWQPLLIGLVVAILLIAIYVAAIGRKRGVTPPPARR